jgi:hypothetical protein
MSIKGKIKHALLGAPGSRPRRVSRGLLRGAMFNVDTMHRSMRLLGLDETEIAGWTRKLTAEATVAVDVGANDGWYSTYYAIQPQIKRVYAFEPDERLHEAFRQNLRLNGEAALAKCIHSSLRVGAVDDALTCRLDTVLKNEHEPMVMKIDIEGAELDALKGAEQTLRRVRCGLVIESHSLQLEKDCQAYLQTLDYQTRIVRPGWYRAIVPEERNIPHNQWLIATKRL